MASGPITSWQMDGKTMETETDLFFWAPKSLEMVTATMKLKDVSSMRDVMGGRWEGGSCLGTHVHLWWIHVNVWQNQYSIVK